MYTVRQPRPGPGASQHVLVPELYLPLPEPPALSMTFHWASIGKTQPSSCCTLCLRQLLHLTEDRSIYGKLIFVVCQISHWHCIHSKMRTVPPPHSVWVTWPQSPSFYVEVRSFSGWRIWLKLANSAFPLGCGTLFCLSSPSLDGSLSSNNSNNASFF